LLALDFISKVDRHRQLASKIYLFSIDIARSPSTVSTGTSFRISTRPISIKVSRSSGLIGDNFVRPALISRNVQRRCIAFATPSSVFLSPKIRVLVPLERCKQRAQLAALDGLKTQGIPFR
jgi:hypothetical protein